MTDSRHTPRLSADDWDEQNFPRPAENDFDRVVERALSRRGFLGAALVFGSGAAVMGPGFLTGAARAQTAAVPAAAFPFKPIPIATDGTIQVPAGYEWRVLTAWGEPIFPDVPEFDHATGGSLDTSDKVFGENTDGMEFFVIGDRRVIAVNHEYVNPKVNLPQATDGVPRDAADVRKLQNLQGVSVIEVADGPQGWSVVKDSPLNRRIDHNTPMRIAGPAAGHALMRTAADATGTTALGTLNNCGSGRTPWGTYLTCEENFNSYFGATGVLPTEGPLAEGYARYGIAAAGSGYDYHKWDPRFDVTATPNEPHRAGWVVEIDPADPASVPVKRTALGRFKHENAECVLAPDGRVVVYLGDDERGEFLYRFVSAGTFVEGGDTTALLDEGQLYVARFNDDMSGEWLALTPEATGMDAATIAIFTRQAASRVGATTMDRPEWVAVNPLKPEAYCALTNNKNRGVKPNEGGDATPVGGANPREANHYGQIVRWRPAGGDHAADGFYWDLYVMAGNPTVHQDAYAGSANINPGNLFNSPDGMAVDQTGLVWIQTDGEDTNEGDFAGMGNNQMLCGHPDTGEIVRFLTGPKGAEVTGLCWSDDRRTMFVGIQHPEGAFPAPEGTTGVLPRSAVVAVRRADGGLVG